MAHHKMLLVSPFIPSGFPPHQTWIECSRRLSFVFSLLETTKTITRCLHIGYPTPRFTISNLVVARDTLKLCTLFWNLVGLFFPSQVQTNQGVTSVFLFAFSLFSTKHHPHNTTRSSELTPKKDKIHHGQQATHPLARHVSFFRSH